MNSDPNLAAERSATLAAAGAEYRWSEHSIMWRSFPYCAQAGGHTSGRAGQQWARSHAYLGGRALLQLGRSHSAPDWPGKG